MKSAIFVNGNKVEMDYPQFNAGERNIKIPKNWLTGHHPVPSLFGQNKTRMSVRGSCEVYALLFDSNSIMDLLLVCDAVRGMGVRDIDLTIPYVAYARQDRRCVEGEPHSLKVFSNLINYIGARKVTVYDPHSDVCEALIDNIEITQQHEPLIDSVGIPTQLYDCIISPDGGAIKKCSKLLTEINSLKGEGDTLSFMESAQKKRNLKTGKIEKVVFNPSESIDGKRCCVFDDLADLGGSFYYLGKEIRDNFTPKVLDLYVTHGLFVEGAEKLYKIFDNIYTLDYTDPKDIKVIRLENE